MGTVISSVAAATPEGFPIAGYIHVAEDNGQDNELEAVEILAGILAAQDEFDITVVMTTRLD